MGTLSSELSWFLKLLLAEGALFGAWHLVETNLLHFGLLD